jgi:hypothetical protein
VPSLQQLVNYIREKICKTSSDQQTCEDQASALARASYLDIDFDIISHALVINAFWATAPYFNMWTEKIASDTKGPSSSIDSNSKIEIGVLNAESTKEPEELSLAGFLTVLGEDEKASPTHFSFPSRHHPLPSDDTSTYSVSFKHPTGLHPTMQLTFSTKKTLQPPRDDGCYLHTYLTLPSYLFIDKYQFNDRLFLDSHKLVALHSIAGETDLELPDYAIDKWGSAALFELSSPPPSSSGSTSGADSAWNVTIPLHLRYLAPAHNVSGIVTVPVPWPVVFWACTASEGTKMNVNPFDRIHLGFDALFGPRTMFFHIPPNSAPASGSGVQEGVLLSDLKVPVLDLDRAWYVEIGTWVVVLAGFGWLLWKLWGILDWDVIMEGEFDREVEEKGDGEESKKKK